MGGEVKSSAQPPGERGGSAGGEERSPCAPAPGSGLTRGTSVGLQSAAPGCSRSKGGSSTPNCPHLPLINGDDPQLWSAGFSRGRRGWAPAPPAAPADTAGPGRPGSARDRGRQGKGGTDTAFPSLTRHSPFSIPHPAQPVSRPTPDTARFP